MSDDAPIDFSPLDPQRDPARWHATVNAIADRAAAPSILQAIAGAWRLALGLATAAALAVWLLAPPPVHDEARRALLTWAADPSADASAELLASLEAAP